MVVIDLKKDSENFLQEKNIFNANEICAQKKSVEREIFEKYSNYFDKLFSEDQQLIKKRDPDFNVKRINNLFKSRIANYLQTNLKIMTQND